MSICPKREVLNLILSNWRTLLRWLLRIPLQPEITVDELYQRLASRSPPLLVDIRTVEEFNGTDEYSKYGHIPDSISIPIMEMDSMLDQLEQHKNLEIVTMCPRGGMSLVAVEVFNEVGFNDVKSLKGGTDAWHKKGYPAKG